MFGLATLFAFGSQGNANATVESPEIGQGALDGLTFTGMIGPDGAQEDVVDTFVFEQGNFKSLECELRCDYPARPYHVRMQDGVTSFSSETKCPYKDATIVWRGTIEDDQLIGVAEWTMRRWYWTVTRDFTFTAKLDEPIIGAASN